MVLAALLLVQPADTIGAEDIQEAYAEVIDVVRQGAGEEAFVAVVVRRWSAVPEENPLRGFLRDNPYMLTYLLHNALGFDAEAVLSSGQPPESADNAFFRALRADSQFNRLTVGLVASYLRHRGAIVRGGPSLPTRTRSLGQIQTLAVRFFYPDGVDQTGRLTGHICAGINGVEDFPDRDTVVEAIVYAAIFERLRQQPDSVLAEFGSAMREAERLELSADPSIRVRRAQGVVWQVMANSAYLRELLAHYVARREWLPIDTAGPDEGG